MSNPLNICKERLLSGPRQNVYTCILLVDYHLEEHNDKNYIDSQKHDMGVEEDE